MTYVIANYLGVLIETNLKLLYRINNQHFYLYRYFPGYKKKKKFYNKTCYLYTRLLFDLKTN